VTPKEEIAVKQPRTELPTRLEAGDVPDWPPSHTVCVDDDYVADEFSPCGPMGQVIEHLKPKLDT